MKKVITYTGAEAEDFASWEIKQKKLPPDYAYFPKTFFRKGFAFVFYHLIATPLVFLMQKILYGERIVGRKKLRPYRKSGYFLYGNRKRRISSQIRTVFRSPDSGAWWRISGLCPCPQAPPDGGISGRRSGSTQSGDT